MSSSPTVFGRYQLIEPIAQGGMAEVFKARLVAAAGTEKLVCIKRILPELLQNRDFLTLFVKEAKIALPLSHGNITQVFDFGEEEGIYYLAMEYIPGQNLHQVLKRVQQVGGKLDLGAALYIATEVCKGLHFAHSYAGPNGKPQPVIHRDVTPHNILISYSGEVKLTDFGIALAATMASTSENVLRGKVWYLSPEQAAGHPGEPRSDIFSLGTVLYEMLTGVRPFSAATDQESLELVRQVKVVPPSQLNDGVDKALEAVVLKAMARQPADRYARAGEMQVALSQRLHQRVPDFTASSLSSIIKELFSWEIAQQDQGKSGGDFLKDRLLFQLSRAGVNVDGSTASTEELLEMGTVAIAGAPPRQTRPARARYWGLGAGLAALTTVVILAVWLFLPSNTKPPQEKSELATTTPAFLVTDHLAPSSAKNEPSEPSVKPSHSASEKDEPKTIRLARKMGYLNCNSWPWSIVYLNGRRLPGNTPLFRVKVPAGRHQLRFANPELGLSKEVSITIRAGNIKTVAVSLKQ